MSMEKENNAGTFIVKIMNQQKSTWQGSVTWVEAQKTQNFRSALELIKMLDEAIGTAENSEDKRIGTAEKSEDKLSETAESGEDKEV